MQRQMPKSKFVKVKCKKCKNEQILFNKAATIVRCLVCESVLAQPKGGLADIQAPVIEVMDS